MKREEKREMGRKDKEEEGGGRRILASGVGEEWQGDRRWGKSNMKINKEWRSTIRENGQRREKWCGLDNGGSQGYMLCM